LRLPFIQPPILDAMMLDFFFVLDAADRCGQNRLDIMVDFADFDGL
jgi:hypothetical protein